MEDTPRQKKQASTPTSSACRESKAEKSACRTSRSLGWVRPVEDRPMTTTCRTEAASRHSSKTPEPTMPVAPNRRTFISSFQSSPFYGIRPGSLLSQLLGQPNEYALGAPDVAEPIHVAILDHLADEPRAALAQSGERIVEVLHGEHDAQVTKRVDWGV